MTDGNVARRILLTICNSAPPLGLGAAAAGMASSGTSSSRLFHRYGLDGWKCEASLVVDYLLSHTHTLENDCDTFPSDAVRGGQDLFSFCTRDHGRWHFLVSLLVGAQSRKKTID